MTIQPWHDESKEAISRVCGKWLKDEEITEKDINDYCRARHYLYTERSVDAEACANWKEVKKCYRKFGKALSYIIN